MTIQRRTMLNVVWTLCAAACFGLGTVQAEDKADAKGEGWVDLLKAGDLSQWTTKGNWSINEQKEVTLTPREGEKGWSRFDAYLWSNQDYTDFEVKFDYRVQKNGNSGFYFHVGDVANPVNKGIEVQIYDSFGKPADKKLTDHDSGGIIPGVPPTKNAAKETGTWNTFHIVCQGDELKVNLNGELVNTVDLSAPKFASRPKTGRIGFQDHGLPLGLRNIQVKSLDK